MTKRASARPAASRRGPRGRRAAFEDGGVLGFLAGRSGAPTRTCRAPSADLRARTPGDCHAPSNGGPGAAASAPSAESSGCAARYSRRTRSRRRPSAARTRRPTRPLGPSRLRRYYQPALSRGRCREFARRSYRLWRATVGVHVRAVPVRPLGLVPPAPPQLLAVPIDDARPPFCGGPPRRPPCAGTRCGRRTRHQTRRPAGSETSRKKASSDRACCTAAPLCCLGMAATTRRKARKLWRLHSYWDSDVLVSVTCQIR